MPLGCGDLISEPGKQMDNDVATWLAALLPINAENISVTIIPNTGEPPSPIMLSCLRR